MANADQVGFFYFLQGPLCPICVSQSGVSVHGHYYCVNGCQICNLEDRMPRANLQMEGHRDMPFQSTKDPGGQEHWVVLPPTCHFGPWPGGHHLAALISGTAW